MRYHGCLCAWYEHCTCPLVPMTPEEEQKYEEAQEFMRTTGRLMIRKMVDTIHRQRDEFFLEAFKAFDKT